MRLNKGDNLIAKQNKIRVNEKITARKVRLISNDGEQVGIVTIDQALEAAQNVGLDLVEISPNADPPVCKVLDYGKLKYEEKKKTQLNKKKQHVVKLKEIRLRPSIDDHDLNTKLNMGKKFLKDGCKLKVTIMFRGREMSRLDLGDIVMDKVKTELQEVANVEKLNPLEGRRMSIIFTSK